MVKTDPIHDAGNPYEFSPGKVFNLIADDCVKDHSDICGRQVIYAALEAITRA